MNLGSAEPSPDPAEESLDPVASVPVQSSHNSDLAEDILDQPKPVCVLAVLNPDTSISAPEEPVLVNLVPVELIPDPAEESSDPGVSVPVLPSHDTKPVCVTNTTSHEPASEGNVTSQTKRRTRNGTKPGAIMNLSILLTMQHFIWSIMSKAT